jgi:hypothetical protein
MEGLRLGFFGLLPPALKPEKNEERMGKMLDFLRRGSSPADPAEPDGPDDSPGAPFPGYDKLDERQISERLVRLTQVELAAVEEYERSHLDRPQVIDKLRYMRVDEPLPDYDTLSFEQIAEALAGADSETVKGVRDYERKFRHRANVMAEAAHALTTAEPSPKEARAREAQKARVREGFKKRAKTTGSQ